MSTTERDPLTIHVPIRGKLLIQLDGTDVLHEVGDFSQDVSVAFTPGPGEVSFQFDPKFWEGAVKPEGGRTSDPSGKLMEHPNKSTYRLVLDVLVAGGVKLPEPLAESICDTLGREGRLSA